MDTQVCAAAAVMSGRKGGREGGERNARDGAEWADSRLPCHALLPHFQVHRSGHEMVARGSVPDDRCTRVHEPWRRRRFDAAKRRQPARKYRLLGLACLAALHTVRGPICFVHRVR
eukprot:354857-Chlamydomonas_euryale.AAC.41